MRLTQRERILKLAAIDALAALEELQDENSFGEHLGSEQAVVERLREALRPYKRTPMLTPKDALAAKWESP